MKERGDLSCSLVLEDSDLLLANGFFDTCLAEEVEAVLDHSWVVDRTHADGAVKTCSDRFDIRDSPHICIDGCNQAGLLAYLS